MRSQNCSPIVLVAILIVMLSTCAMSQPADIEPAPQTVAASENAFVSIPESCIETRESLERSCTGSCPSVICCDSCPDVYGEVEALYMQRVPRVGRQTIIEDFNSQQAVISTSDFRFDFEPGLRATAGIRLNDCRALEFSYMGLFEADSLVGVTASGGSLLKVPDPLGSAEGVNVFRDMNRATVTYSSTLNSFELNLPCCCCSTCCDCDRVCCRSFEWFAGFRYINLTEDLNMLAERQEFGGTETGTYKIHASDNLFGAQLGARVRRGCNRFRWELVGKAGIYGNDACQDQQIIDFPNFPLRPSISAERGLAAFVGELPEVPAGEWV